MDVFAYQRKVKTLGTTFMENSEKWNVAMTAEASLVENASACASSESSSKESNQSSKS